MAGQQHFHTKIKGFYNGMLPRAKGGEETGVGAWGIKLFFSYKEIQRVHVLLPPNYHIPTYQFLPRCVPSGTYILVLLCITLSAKKQ